MGFFDDVVSAAQRSKEAVERKSRETQIKMKISDLIKQRKDLAAQLGASLYEDARLKAEFVSGREGLFQAIENIDVQREAAEQELAQIQAEEAAAQANQVTYQCPKCGSTVRATDMFCAGCGSPVADIIAAQQQPSPEQAGRFCTNCGAQVAENDAFCTSCGARIDAPIVDVEPCEPETSEEPATEESAAPAEGAAPAEEA